MAVANPLECEEIMVSSIAPIGAVGTYPVLYDSYYTPSVYWTHRVTATQAADAVQHITEKVETTIGGTLTNTSQTVVTVYDRFGNLQTIPDQSWSIATYA